MSKIKWSAACFLSLALLTGCQRSELVVILSANDGVDLSSVEIDVCETTYPIGADQIGERLTFPIDCEGSASVRYLDAQGTAHIQSQYVTHGLQIEVTWDLAETDQAD